MQSTAAAPAGLAPLAYHHTVVAYLRAHEPDVWQWAAARVTDAAQRDALRTALLRDTYRLDPAAHPAAHAQLATALERLGMHVPATLYQSTGSAMNAMLVYVPGEVHIVLEGPVLERLSSDELLAILGHELAHYLLWSRDDGVFVAERILSDGAASPAAAPSHLETWRRYALHTELFADRGAAIAAGAIGPAIGALVKVQTGSGTVDPVAYLRQAAEVEADTQRSSTAHTHPELFIRARALALWWERDPDLDDWIAARLHGPLALDRLDLPGQVRLQALSRGFLARYLDGDRLASAAVLAQVRALFPDWSGTEPAAALDAFAPAQIDAGLLGYLNALMLDLALADPDQQEAALLRAGVIATAIGGMDDLLAALRRHAGFGKRELERYKRQLEKETPA